MREMSFWFAKPRCSLSGSLHRTVLEVELVSFQDNKTWFVFEVELDGNTKISHISKSLVSKSWEMSKVAAAANKILKLPAVPSRAYSMISLVLMMLFSAAWDQDRDRSM